MKGYIIVFDTKKDGIRYFCPFHATYVINHQKEWGFKFMSEIHGDIYHKKCHLCKKTK